MKQAFLLAILFPIALSAQLDRVRTNMTEAEFVKEFPEAKRDLESEAVWVGEAATINGVEGNSLWRIYNDTISEYRFNSTKAQGPSAQYPKFDSTAVHKMRVAAEAIRTELEKAFGKPAAYSNVQFTSVGDDTYPGSLAYLAKWTFGPDDYIKLQVSTDLSTGNFINAPGKYTVVESESYELSVEVKHRSTYTMENYSVGMDDDAFFKTHINASAQVKAKRDHIYVIKDSLTSENAKWEFAFAGGEVLLYFTYKAYLGEGYGSKSADEAYHKAGAKTDAMLKQRNENCGGTTESSYNKPVVYKPHDVNVAYNVSYIHAVWATPRGNIFLDYTEFGGGKNPEPVFYVQVHFEFTP